MLSARKTRTIGMLLTLALIAIAVAGAAGCTEQPKTSTTQESTQDQPDMQTASDVPAEATEPMPMEEMGCSNCGDSVVPDTKGTATTEAGVQVVKIGVKDGYYSPNNITVTTGTPVKVIFSGDAKKCLGKPKFPALNKQADFTTTGEATLDLGTLAPGTYKLTCGMGSDGGQIVVQ